MRKKLLPLIPAHKTYVEAFGGAASMLFAKRPSEVEVYNDIDSDVVNFFRVLRDREKFERFREMVTLTPYSREEFLFCLNTLESTEDEVERAYKFFVVVRQSFGAMGRTWGYVVTTSIRGMAKLNSNWLSAIENLDAVYERFMRVQIEHNDFRKVLLCYDSENTFFYLDPPYLATTRKYLNLYKHEMSNEDHKELIEIITNLRSKVLISGYDNELYSELDRRGWQRKEWETACMMAGRNRNNKIIGEGAAKAKVPRKEVVWFNYNPPSKQLF